MRPETVEDAPRRNPEAPPRICHLITRLVIGGAQRIALESAAHAIKRGWDAQLWCGPETGPEGSLQEEAVARGVPLTIVPDLVRAVSPRRDLCALRSLEQRLRAGGFDLVHTHSSKAGIIGRLAAARARVPVRIHSVHGWGMTPDTTIPARLLFTRLERIAARRAHVLVAVSAAVRDAGLKRGIGRPDQYVVIHGGIPMNAQNDGGARARAREALGLPPQAFVLGTIARLDDAKDPLGALAGAVPLLRANPDWRMVFIGDGKLRPALARAVAEEGMRDRVTLPGRRGDAAKLAAGFDIFFLASRWEGFPLAVIEAMAAGLPVVAYDVAGLREAVANGVNGFLVPPGERNAWRLTISTLMADAALRARMGAEGRRIAAERFNLAGMLSSLDTVYERAMQRSAAGE